MAAKTFFFPPVLRLYATRWVMTDLKRLYNTWFDLAHCPLFHPFLELGFESLFIRLYLLRVRYITIGYTLLE